MIPSHLAAYIERETERRVDERLKLLQAEDFYTLAEAVDGNALQDLLEKVVLRLRETYREQVEFEVSGHYGVSAYGGSGR